MSFTAQYVNLVAASHHQLHHSPPPSNVSHELLPVCEAVVNVDLNSELSTAKQ